MEDTKAFNVRIPKTLWKFLRNASLAQEVSMNKIIITQMEKYKKSYEKRLTSSNEVVS